MARGVQLSQLVKDVRAECGHSMSVSQGVNTREKIQYLLRRTQTELFEANEWPQLFVYRDVLLHAGDKTYDFPIDFSFEHTLHLHYLNGTTWSAVPYGIGDAEYSVYSTDTENPTRASPVQRWNFDPDNAQFEVWPVPPTDGTVRLWGTKARAPFIAEGDRCTLDGTMLVLFVASEILAKSKSEDAQIKLQKAQELLRRLKARSVSNKTGTVVLGGVDPYNGRSTKRPYLDYIPRGG